MSESHLLLILISIALFALFSGPISRGSLTPPMVFVFLGLISSPIGFGWIDLAVDYKIIHVIAEITLILAVILAPTDAALGPVVVSSPSVPERIRQSLNVESGVNDGIALPALLFVISFAAVAHGNEQDTDWIPFVLQ